MEQIRKSTIFKIIIGIGFILSLVGSMVFSALCAGFTINTEVYGGPDIEEVKKSVVGKIAYDYVNTAVQDYYYAVLKKDENLINYYVDYFSKNNCNMAFTITPIDKNIDEYPILSNYEPEGKTKYHYQDKHYLETDTVHKTIRLNMKLDEIYRKLSEANGVSIAYCLQNGHVVIYDNGKIYKTGILYDGDEYYEETYEEDGSYEQHEIETQDVTEAVVVDDNYDATTEAITIEKIGETANSDEETTFEWRDGMIYDLSTGEYINVDYTFEYNPDSGQYIYLNEDLDNLYIYYVYYEGLRYYLNSDEQFYEKYNEMLDSLSDGMVLNAISTYYDAAAQQVVIKCDYEDGVFLNVDYEVDEQFDAKDNFCRSTLLKYIDDIYAMSLPGLIISLVFLTLFTICICLSAGHVKSSDEITMNQFDKIPLDILLVAIFAIMLFSIMGMYNQSAVSLVIGSVGLFVILVMSPFMLETIATRFKLGRVIKSTLLWIICAVIVKLIIKMFKYTKENLNIFWKVGLAYLVISVAELALMVFACAGLGVVSIVLFLVIKYLLAILIAISVVNMYQLKKAGDELAGGNSAYKVKAENMLWDFKKHGENLNNIGVGIQLAVDESIKSERLKTELITNVSHDIKTPLTSIINYVDLLEKEDIKNEKAQEYLEVLDRQSARLKKLIEDLLEASKASTGNINVELGRINVNVIMEQLIGEFEDKLQARKLKTIVNVEKDINTEVFADGRLLYRTMDNLMVNICKYSEEKSRVYIDVKKSKNKKFIESNNIPDSNGVLEIAFKNISKDELNISGDELMERFVRGDSSRNTEGSGLGLSIARSLMNVQQGGMEIIVDGDLFKVVLYLPMTETVIEEKETSENV